MEHLLSRVFYWLFILIVSQGWLLAQNEKFKERFDQFELEAATLDDGYLVFYYHQNITDERSIGGEEALVEDMARVALLKSGQQRRMDGATIYTVDFESLKRQHYLFARGSWLWAGGNGRNPSIQEVKKDDKILPRVSDVNPIWSSLSVETEFRRGRTADFYEKIRRSKLVSEGLGENGNYYAILVYTTGRGGIRIEYGRKPSWAPVRYTAYFIGKEEGVDINNVTEREILSWHIIGRTETEWEEVTNDRWLPKRLAMMFSSKTSGVKYESETRFAGWKFGKDVDQKLFDPKLFTSEELGKIDFEAWDKEYFKPKPKK